jgi:glutamate synthase domain-containing protein 3
MPVKTIAQARDREVVTAATGATGNSATMPKQLNALLGTRFRVVPGYSTTEARLSLERGEAVVIERPVRNVNRTVGAMLSGIVAKKHGHAGLLAQDLAAAIPAELERWRLGGTAAMR